MIMFVSHTVTRAINTLALVVSFIILFSFTISVVNAADQKKLTVHGLFTDHAVFQRGVEVPVWGTTLAGATVKVVFSGQTQYTRADHTGQWMVKLNPLVANAEGESLTVTSVGQTETRIDILVGEVWLASGQSNMSMAMFVADPFNPPTSIPSLGDGSFTPSIRLMQMEVNGKSDQLSSKLKKNEKWKLSDVTGLYYFSSVGYYFARELNQTLDVPIGIISSAGGGTSIRQWIPDSALQSDKCGELGSSAKYNYSIAPLMPYAIKGVIWYQGEANAKGVLVDCYFDDFISLIDSWRSEWANAAQRSRYDFPFYFVQLPNYEAGANGHAWVKIREQMLKVNLETKNTEMVVSIDVGNANDVHPRLKLPVAERLAKIARALEYEENIIYSGPVYQSMNIRGNTAILSFTHKGSGLASINGQPLKYFEISGMDGIFYSAKAVISGNSVEVKSNAVLAPVNVRYAWLSNPENPNFSNLEGLMATPFRTDAEFFNTSVVAKPLTGGGNKLIKPIYVNNKILLANEVTNSIQRTGGVLTTFDDLSVGIFSSGTITDSLGYIFEDAGWLGPRNIETLGIAEGYVNKVIQNSSYSRVIRMRKTGAEAFNLISFDHAVGRWGLRMDAFVTAYFQDGSTVTITISSNTKKMTTQVVNWRGLDKVEFNYRGGRSEAYGVLDNFFTERRTTGNNNKPVTQVIEIETSSIKRTSGVLTTFDDLSVGIFASGIISNSLGYIFEDAGWMGPLNIETLGIAEGYVNKVIQNSSYGRIIRMRKTGAETFNLISFDYAVGRWGLRMDASVTAHFQDGSTKTIFISSNTKKLTTQVVNWRGLDKVEFNYRGGNNDAYGVLDNFFTERRTTDNNNKPVAQVVEAVTSCSGSIELDGIDDWANIPDLLLKTDFTIEGWVNLASIVDSKSAMIGQEGFGPDINFHDGKVRLFAYGDRVVSKTALRPETWEHIAISRSGDSLKLYINGVEDATGRWNGYMSLKAIGRGNRGFFNGKLDEIRVWNVARTGAEINANYKKVVNPNHHGLIGYWNFNETNQTILDVSNAKNHGSLGLTTAVGIDDPLRKISANAFVEKCK